MEEYELLNKIKKNPSEFAELFKVYYTPIFGYILRRTGDFDISADIAADTFLNAFKNIGLFSYRGISIKVWLYRIATNEVNQYFRFKQKRNLLFEKIAVENRSIFNNLMEDDKQELEIEMQKHKMYLSVLKELKSMPIKYQEVLSLRYFEGKNIEEISEILATSEGTIKSLLSRGVKKLREKCNQI